ncbi:MAG: LysR family transcriptional regulator [Candidatus Lokiarchaeota archaeon]|nr:LysR family transcriptional regulator [Candidatus Lokiarchaeota archaeon]
MSQYKSFSNLSKELSISQSTLSHRIFQLEEELGNIKLINRTTKKFELTLQGKLFLEYAHKIIGLYDECQERLNNFQKKISETIIITTSKLPGAHILPKYITDFKERYPQVHFKILINNTKESIKILRKKEANFAGIGSFMNYNRNEFDYLKIGDDTIHFICSNNHELLENGNEKINFDDLKKFPFISRENGSGTRMVFENQFPKFNELNIKLEINDNDSIISAVSESNYISVVSQLIGKKAVDAGLIKIITLEQYPQIAKRDIFISKLKNKKLEKLKKEFWNYIKEKI